MQLWATLRDYGKDPTRTTLQQPGLQLGCAHPPDVIMREQVRWERRRQEETVAENLALMNDDEGQFFDRVRAAVTDGAAVLPRRPSGHRQDAPLQRQEIALPMAWSGLAATVLPGGRTVHATFKLPVPMPTADASFTLEAQTDNGSLVRAARLIIWDEAPNAPRAAFEAVERRCRFLSGESSSWGGDFRQIPPVVRHAKVQEVAHLTLQAWRPYIENAERFALTDNMRAREDRAGGRLTGGSGDVGRGGRPPTQGLVEQRRHLPDRRRGYRGQRTHPRHARPKGGGGRGGERKGAGREGGAHSRWDSRLLRSYVSEDAVFTDDPDTQDMVTKEFLHETTPSGTPPHILEVRENAVLMTPRNLAPDVGLCNGTRIRVLRTFEHSIQVQILQTGQRCFVPRITMTSTEECDLPSGDARLRPHDTQVPGTDLPRPGGALAEWPGLRPRTPVRGVQSRHGLPQLRRAHQ